MMEPRILYWYWLAFGMLLVIAELFIPSFTIFWFGLGAIIVGVLLLFFPHLLLAWQLFIWAVASILFTVLWFRYFRPLMTDRTKAGIAKEAIVGESGQVIKIFPEKNRGIVRFTIPVLGADEWTFICSQAVSPGEQVVVLDISGNALIVEKRDSV